LPRLGILNLKEHCYIPTDEHILSATVSKKANRYFVSVAIEKELELIDKKSNAIIGVDLGIKSLAVTSNGLSFENPKAYKKFLKKLKREQRWLSRKVKGSNNRRKQQKEVARIHYKISNIRKDNIHKMTTTIVKNQPKAIVIENLSVSGMLKNHCLSQAIADSSFGEIRRQFEYKTNWNNIQLVVVDRFYASSKLCSFCGYKNVNLTLKDREWVCPQCNTTHDRDKNAAINLSKYYSTVSSTGINASGEDKVQSDRNIRQWSSVKEEINRTDCYVKSL
jgi:putative transposase